MVWNSLQAQLAAAALDTTVEKLDATKADDLKAVFFSGEPWLVQCGSKADLASSSVDAGLSVHEVVELALPKLPSEAKVGVLDCARKLPSGKTALERFAAFLSAAPQLFEARSRVVGTDVQHGNPGTVFCVGKHCN